jgi:DNA-binding transcriptional LysR family regulator
MDRFDTLAAFVFVAEARGFAPAARRLGLSPSAVTRLVAALEARLGIRLLQRTTRSVALTDAGARYLERARRILADLDEADGSAQAEIATPTGRLVVSAPMTFGRLHVSPVMCHYLRLNPGVVGELALGDRLVNLVEEGVDLAVRIGTLTDSSLVVRRIGETRRVVVASPDYLARRGRPSHPAALAAHAVIQFSGLTHASDWPFQHNGRSELHPVAPHYLTNSAEAAIWHAERNGGLTMVLAYQVADHLRSGRLEIVLTAFEPPPLPIQFVYPTSRLLSAKVRSFIDMAIEMSDWHFVNF